MLRTVESSARKLIEQYRLRAVFVAIERLNESLDRRDFHSRDFWAQVVHAIHEFHRAGELSADGIFLTREPNNPAAANAPGSRIDRVDDAAE